MVKTFCDPCDSDGKLLVDADLKSNNERFYSLNVSLSFINDDDERSSVSSHVVCVSKDKQQLQHYADVLNEANMIRLKICPRNIICEKYEVRFIEFI